MSEVCRDIKPHLHVLHLVRRHLDLSYHDLVLLLEVLPDLLPDGLHSLAVRAPVGVELDKYRNTRVINNGMEIVSNKYLDWPE